MNFRFICLTLKSMDKVFWLLVQKYRDPQIIFRFKCKPYIFPKHNAYHVSNQNTNFYLSSPILKQGKTL